MPISNVATAHFCGVKTIQVSHLSLYNNIVFPTTDGSCPDATRCNKVEIKHLGPRNLSFRITVTQNDVTANTYLSAAFTFTFVCKATNSANLALPDFNGADNQNTQVGNNLIWTFPAFTFSGDARCGFKENYKVTASSGSLTYPHYYNNK